MLGEVGLDLFVSCACHSTYEAPGAGREVVEDAGVEGHCE